MSIRFTTIPFTFQIEIRFLIEYYMLNMPHDNAIDITESKV